MPRRSAYGVAILLRARSADSERAREVSGARPRDPPRDLGATREANAVATFARPMRSIHAALLDHTARTPCTFSAPSAAEGLTVPFHASALPVAPRDPALGTALLFRLGRNGLQT